MWFWCLHVGSGSGDGASERCCVDDYDHDESFRNSHHHLCFDPSSLAVRQVSVGVLGTFKYYLNSNFCFFDSIGCRHTARQWLSANRKSSFRSRARWFESNQRNDCCLLRMFWLCFLLFQYSFIFRSDPRRSSAVTASEFKWFAITSVVYC